MTFAQRLDAARLSISLGNNGYADIGNDVQVADALIAEGFTVVRSTNLHGRPTFRGFTAAAQAAVAADYRAGSPFAVSTYKPIASRGDGPDYEAAILARQEARFEF